MLRRFGVTDRRAKIFDVFVVIFAILGIAQIARQFDYRIPVEVHQRVFRELVVPAGGFFVYENYFTRFRYCDTRVDRWFIGSDKVVRPIEPLPSSMPTESLRQKQMSVAKIKVPLAMPPGPSKSCFQSHWSCTYFQELVPINGDPTCLDFTVTPPEPITMWLPEPADDVAMENEP